MALNGFGTRTPYLESRPRIQPATAHSDAARNPIRNPDRKPDLCPAAHTLLFNIVILFGLSVLFHLSQRLHTITRPSARSEPEHSDTFSPA
jgi:hypothetical protein